MGALITCIRDITVYLIHSVSPCFVISDAYFIPSRKKSKRNQGLLLFQGYTYSLRNLKRSGAYWTCSSHHKKGCKANITTEEDGHPYRVVKVYTEHNHPAPVINIPEDAEC